MDHVPPDIRQQWAGWVHVNVQSEFRKKALKAALQAIALVGTQEHAIGAALQSAAEQADYMARLALVYGGIGVATALLFGHGSVPAALFAVVMSIWAVTCAVMGRHSTHRRWQAWAGVGLGVVGGAKLYTFYWLLR